MGDIIHLLPALTDASRMIADIQFDWVVEENFAEIPRWHPRVHQILPIALRRWRKQITARRTWQEVYKFIRQLRAKKYDLVIDAQGLLKSAWITYLSRGLSSGLNWHSAWEPLASICYRKKYEIDPKQHAVSRMRNLMAKALNYLPPVSTVEYGLEHTQFRYVMEQTKYVVFIHGTTWQSKLWPEQYWIELAKLLNQAGFAVVLPWGNLLEQQRAQAIAKQCAHALVLSKLKLKEIAGVIAQAKGVVAVDTGLGHLTAALNIPCVSLYGPTSVEEVGTIGKNQRQLSQPFECAPCRNEICRYDKPTHITPACFASITPIMVYQQLLSMLEQNYG